MIAIVDYGAGNLRSVAKAIAKLGYEGVVTDRPADLGAARAVILPGVGAATEAMASLRRLRLVQPLKEIVAWGKPFFGVCLGLQLLLTLSEEGPEECLGLIEGTVRRLPGGLKVPHMGWNQVAQSRPHPIFEGIPDQAYFYFVHSYYPAPADRSIVAGETEYGLRFASVLVKDNLVATQFHPEKSGALGLRLYDNFFRLYL